MIQLSSGWPAMHAFGAVLPDFVGSWKPHTPPKVLDAVTVKDARDLFAHCDYHALEQKLWNTL